MLDRIALHALRSGFAGREQFYYLGETMTGNDRVRGAGVWGVVAGAVLGVVGAASVAEAVPTATILLRLTEPDDVTKPLPVGAGGAVHLSPGQMFRVVVRLHIDNPNLVGAYAFRGAEVRGLPLGLSVMSTDIVTVAVGSPLGALGDAATAGAIEPVIGGYGVEFPVPQWAGYGEDSPGDLSTVPWINLLDLGQDGDLDVAGSGIGQSVMGAPRTAALLAKYQYGAAGTARYDVDLYSGLFVAGPNIGRVPVELRTHTTSFVTFIDNGTSSFFAGSGLILSGVKKDGAVIVDTGVSATGAYYEAASLTLVPEPASVALAGLSVTGAGFTRWKRRIARLPVSRDRGR